MSAKRGMPGTVGVWDDCMDLLRIVRLVGVRDGLSVFGWFRDALSGTGVIDLECRIEESSRVVVSFGKDGWKAENVRIARFFVREAQCGVVRQTGGC